MANAKEINVDTDVVAGLSELEDIFTLEDQ